MIRKYAMPILSLFLLMTCSKKPMKEKVVYFPENPQAGETIAVKFFPKRLIQPQQKKYSVFLIYQLYAPGAVSTKKIIMQGNGNPFEAEIETDARDYLLSIKFEDNMERYEDNSGLGWNFPLKYKSNKIQRNSMNKMGSIYDGLERPVDFPNYLKAINFYQKEISLFPDNYLVWFDLWFSQIKSSILPEEEIKKVRTALDSLLSSPKESLELLGLAFKTNLYLLADVNRASQIGKQLADEQSNFPQKDEILYLNILLKGSANPAVMIKELKQHLDTTTSQKILKQAFYQMGEYYRQQKNTELSIFYFEKLKKIDPSNIESNLILANQYIKTNNFQNAQQVLDEATTQNTAEHLLLSSPWEKPDDRIAKQNLTQCQIFSTQAVLEEAQQNYEQAIAWRKSCIQHHTPFPAYEWEKIGDLFLQTGKNDSATKAYIKALSENAAQDGARNKLRILYQPKQGQVANYELFLEQAIRNEQKASASLAPEIFLTDLSGLTAKLSQQTAQITVIVFWDTWSEACKKEIPDLNKLSADFEQNNLLAFWAVSVEDAETLLKFAQKQPFHFRQFHSGFAAKKAFEVIGFPSHFIIDGDGKIRYSHVGFSNEIYNELKNELQHLLMETAKIS